MMYFIELSQFSAEDHAITQALRAQMGRRERNSTHWIEWKGDQFSESFWPDVVLVNAACLDWRQLKSIVNGYRASTIVLTGRSDPMLSLPTLPRITNLCELFPLMSVHGRFTTARPSASFHTSQSHRPGWVDTTPMPAQALL